MASNEGRSRQWKWVMILAAANVCVVVDIYVLDQQLIGLVSFVPAEWRTVHSHAGVRDYNANKSTLIFALMSAQLSLLFLWALLGRSFWLTRWLLAVAGGAVCINLLAHVPKFRQEWDEPWNVHFCVFLGACSALAGAVLRLFGYRFSRQVGDEADRPSLLRYRTGDVLVATLAIGVLFAANTGELIRQVVDELPAALRARRSAVISYGSIGRAEIGWLVAHAALYASILAGAAWSMLARRSAFPRILLWAGFTGCGAFLFVGSLRHFQRYAFGFLHGNDDPVSWAAVNCFYLLALLLVPFLTVTRRLGYRLDREHRSGWVCGLQRLLPRRPAFRITGILAAVVLTLSLLVWVGWGPWRKHLRVVRAIDAASEVGWPHRLSRASSNLRVDVTRPLDAKLVELRRSSPRCAGHRRGDSDAATSAARFEDIRAAVRTTFTPILHFVQI